MAVFKDDPSRLIDIDWYFVNPFHNELAITTPFGSNIYDREDVIEPALGEHYSPVPYRTGIRPEGTTTGGLCGSVDQWENGCLTTDPVPPFQPDSISPVCCARVPQWSKGGSREGAKWSQICNWDDSPLPAVLFTTWAANQNAPCNVWGGKVFPLYRAPLDGPPFYTYTQIYQSEPVYFRSFRVIIRLYCDASVTPGGVQMTVRYENNASTIGNANCPKFPFGGPEWFNWWNPVYSLIDFFPTCFLHTYTVRIQA